ncbi:MAG: hypothetical protein M1836_002231 [Candelina mexicana]|nr:MAG: hypothetical protein M1836_002231 [Candelina mexicana]
MESRQSQASNTFRKLKRKLDMVGLGLEDFDSVSLKEMCRPGDINELEELPASAELQDFLEQMIAILQPVVDSGSIEDLNTIKQVMRFGAAAIMRLKSEHEELRRFPQFKNDELTKTLSDRGGELGKMDRDVEESLGRIKSLDESIEQRQNKVVQLDTQLEQAAASLSNIKDKHRDIEETVSQREASMKAREEQLTKRLRDLELREQNHRTQVQDHEAKATSFKKEAAKMTEEKLRLETARNPSALERDLKSKHDLYDRQVERSNELEARRLEGFKFYHLERDDHLKEQQINAQLRKDKDELQATIKTDKETSANIQAINVQLRKDKDELRATINTQEETLANMRQDKAKQESTIAILQTRVSEALKKLQRTQSTLRASVRADPPDPNILDAPFTPSVQFPACSAIGMAFTGMATWEDAAVIHEVNQLFSDDGRIVDTYVYGVRKRMVEAYIDCYERFRHAYEAQWDYELSALPKPK